MCDEIDWENLIVWDNPHRATLKSKVFEILLIKIVMNDNPISK